MNPDFLDRLLGSNLLSEEQIRGFAYEIGCDEFLAMERRLGRMVLVPKQRDRKPRANV